MKEKFFTLINRLKNYVLSNKKRSAVIIAGTVSVIICAVVLLSIFVPKKNDFDGYRNFNTEEIIQDGIVVSGNPVDFTKLKEENSDICAWIRIPGTAVDYPVLRSDTLEEEDFYLDHDYKKKSAAHGAIYMQKINDETFISNNTVLYGHDMLDGTMFADIKKYRNQSFLDKNPLIKIYTPKRILTYKIFSAYKTDDKSIPDTYNFYDEASFNEFTEKCLKSNVSDKSVSPKFGDKLITLSTCTGSKNERFIAVGVLLSSALTK